MQLSKLLNNKRALITGVISTKSIAYGIAQSLYNAGAQLAFSYQNERFKERILEITSEFKNSIIIPCDVSDDQQISDLFKTLQTHWDSFDILIHSIAFAPTDQLKNRYIDQINREGFNIAHDISSYSFAALAKEGYKIMRPGGALLTLTYLGSERVVPNYNIMGLAKASLEANVRYLAYDLGAHDLRVNAISAGPIRTLAASGIQGLKKMIDRTAKISPLKRLTSIEQVGNTATFLCSDLASGITGEIIYVDNGLHLLAIASDTTE